MDQNHNQAFNHQSYLLKASVLGLDEINNTNLKVAEHWDKLKGLFKKESFISELGKRANFDLIQLQNEAAVIIQAWWRGVSCRSKLSKRSKTEKQHIQQNILCETEKENETTQCSFISQNEIMVKAVAHTPPQPQNEAAETTDQTQCQQVGEVEVIIVGKDLIQVQERRTEATIKIQAWWRGILYRNKSMLAEHKEKLNTCVQQVRDAPCSEANPKEERNEPINKRIERYMGGLLSTVLTERKVMSLRLCRLAERSHVSIECMIIKDVFRPILDCLAELNRSEAHLYVIRPLSSLTVKLLSYKPFVQQFAQPHLERLISTAIHLIHNNHRDPDVVVDQVSVLVLLSVYPEFTDKLAATPFNWYMHKFEQLFGRTKRTNAAKDTDPRYKAYRQLCNLQIFVNAEAANREHND